ncbi:MAG: hypothetical protein GY696_27000 [Gammaproteobacteria bacterium]|nr:hypothetical protein [Gammaproteobacteria bacterium]
MTPRISFSFPNYQIFRRDRPDRRGGGLLLLIHHLINTEDGRLDPDVIKALGTSEFQAVRLFINTQWITILNLYKPPFAKVDLNFPLLLPHNYIEMGDVNLHSLAWGSHDSPGGSVLSDAIARSSFQIFLEDDPVPSLTSRGHQTHSRPDLIMAYLPTNCEYTIHIGDNLGSDHHMLCVQLEFPGIPDRRNTRIKRKKTWSFRSANWHEFETLTEELDTVEYDEMSIADAVKAVNTIILNAAQQAIPKGRPRHQKPLWNAKLGRVVNARNKAFRRLQSHKGTQQEKNELRAQYNKARGRARKAQLAASRCKWSCNLAAIQVGDVRKLFCTYQSLSKTSCVRRTTH